MFGAATACEMRSAVARGDVAEGARARKGARALRAAICCGSIVFKRCVSDESR